LNRQIMADLTKRHSKLAAAIADANKFAVRLSNGIYGASRSIKRAQREFFKTWKLYRGKIREKQVHLSKASEDLKSMTGLMFDAKLKIMAIFAKNKVCALKLKGAKAIKAWVGKNLDSERKELSELNGQIEENKEKYLNLKNELSTEQSAHESAMDGITSETARVNDAYQTLKSDFNEKVDIRTMKKNHLKKKKAELEKIQEKKMGSDDAFEKV